MKTMHCYFNFLFKLGQYYLSPAAQPAPRVHSSPPAMPRAGAGLVLRHVVGLVLWHFPRG